MKDKKDLINIDFYVVVTHTKGGNIVWDCGMDNIIGGKEENKAIGQQGFDYKLFKEERRVGVQERE